MGAFVMQILDVDLKDTDEENDCRDLFAKAHLSSDFYSSDCCGNDSVVQTHACFFDVAAVEGALSELSKAHRHVVGDDIRGQVGALETNILEKGDVFVSSLVEAFESVESKRELYLKLDGQYQHEIAEALGSHLTTVQRDHMYLSQIEKRKINHDALAEEARKERKAHEEKLLQEKAKLDAAQKLHEEKLKALESGSKDENEVVEKQPPISLEANSNAGSSTTVASATRTQSQHAQIGSNFGISNFHSSGPKPSNDENMAPSAGDVIQSSKSALILEKMRLDKYGKLLAINKELDSSYTTSFGRHISRTINQISGTKDVVREKANSIICILNDPSCPQSFSIVAFAQKVISSCENSSCAPFALSHSIVLIASKFSLVMEIVLAEMNRACMYSVPKHAVYSNAVFETKYKYKKLIGFREEEGEMESVNKYLVRLESHMKFYGALIQTEIEGVENIHGLKEGWVWLARFLNSIPPNIYTATALLAFLEMGGYGLFKKYKSQFEKLLKVIGLQFILQLKEITKKIPQGEVVIRRLDSYICNKLWLREPQGRTLPLSSLSSSLIPPTRHFHL